MSDNVQVTLNKRVRECPDRSPPVETPLGPASGPRRSHMQNGLRQPSLVEPFRSSARSGDGRIVGASAHRSLTVPTHRLARRPPDPRAIGGQSRASRAEADGPVPAGVPPSGRLGQPGRAAGRPNMNGGTRSQMGPKANGVVRASFSRRYR